MYGNVLGTCPCWSYFNDNWLLIYRWTLSNSLHAIRGISFGCCHGHGSNPHCLLYSNWNGLLQRLSCSQYLVCCLSQAIMMANNIRDLEGDKKSGRKTLAILSGRSTAITILMLFFIISYGWIIALVIFTHLTPWTLLIVLSIKKPLTAIAIFRKNLHPLQVAPAMKETAITNTLFGLLLAIGILLGHLF